MERLTYFDGGKWRIRVGDIEYCGLWVDRLAAYEDTGLEPDEVDQICRASKTMMFKSVADFAQYSIANFDALQAYHALGTVEELAALVKAKTEHKVYRLDGLYCDICAKKHLRVVEVDGIYLTRAEAVQRDGQDG